MFKKFLLKRMSPLGATILRLIQDEKEPWGYNRWLEGDGSYEVNCISLNKRELAIYSSNMILFENENVWSSLNFSDKLLINFERKKLAKEFEAKISQRDSSKLNKKVEELVSKNTL